MIKRFVLFLFCFCLGFCSSFAVIEFDDCINLATSHETYVLNRSFTSSTDNCLYFGNAVTRTNITVDLNGHTITGTGVNDAIESWNTRAKNITIKNGVLDGWARGINWYNDNNMAGSGPIKFVNITTRNNANRGIEIAHADYAVFYINDSRFEDNVYFHSNMNISVYRTVFVNETLSPTLVSNDMLYFEDSSLNYNKPSITSNDNVTLNNTLWNFTNMNFYLNNYENLGPDKNIYLRTLCSNSIYRNYQSHVFIKLQDDMTGSGTPCFEVGNNVVNNHLTIDLGGHTMTGDGAGVAIRTWNMNANNITIQNGIIDNWSTGINWYNDANIANPIGYTFRNITFTNIATNDLDYNNVDYNDAFIENCNFTGTLRLATNRNITLRGKNINSDGQLYISGNSHIIIENEQIVFDTVYLSHNYYTFTNPDNGFYIKDLCGGYYSNTYQQNLIIRFANDIAGSGSPCAGLISPVNMVLDLNGYTLTGDGAGSGVRIWTQNANNFVLRNGRIRNWTDGFYVYGDNNVPGIITVENMTFEDNNLDIRAQSPDDLGFVFIDVNITGSVDFSSTKNITFRGANINSNGQFKASSTEMITIENERFVFDTVYLSHNYYTFTNPDNGFYIKDLCGGYYSNTYQQNLIIRFANDIAGSGSPCAGLLNPVNMVLDLNGYTLTGDGAGSGVRIWTQNANNFVLKNGRIRNWTDGFYVYGDGGTAGIITVENMTFEDNNLDIRAQSPDDFGFVIRNSNFTDALSFSSTGNVTMYGNYIGSGHNITRISTPNFYTYKDFGSGEIGNMWADFSCNDPDDNYVVSHGRYDYTICNSNDYNNNTVGDNAPLIQIEITPPPPGGGGSGGSGSARGGIFPFSGVVPMVIGLVLVLVLGS